MEEVGWTEAMDFFVERFKSTWSLGHETLSCYNSGQLTLEEFYTLAKLWRGGLQSSNIDGNTLMNMYSESDGAGGIQNSGVGFGSSTAPTAPTRSRWTPASTPTTSWGASPTRARIRR